ncbi:hypothetical protein ACHAPJ_012868, partial [Fusarium lateritium]
QYGTEWFGYQIERPRWGSPYKEGRTDGQDNWIQISTHDIIESSLAAFDAGGFNYTIDAVEVSQKIFDFDVEATVRDVVRIPGFFQITICMAQDDDTEEARENFWDALGELFSHTQVRVIYNCWGVKDQDGNTIDDVMDNNWKLN